MIQLSKLLICCCVLLRAPAKRCRHAPLYSNKAGQTVIGDERALCGPWTSWSAHRVDIVNNINIHDVYGVPVSSTNSINHTGFSPDSPKPDSPNLEKVLSMSKCSCFVKKIVLRIFNYIFSPNFLLL